jgi:hypothetical protein
MVLIIWILTWEEGIKGIKNGKPHVFSKTSSALSILIPAFVFPL